MRNNEKTNDRLTRNKPETLATNFEVRINAPTAFLFFLFFFPVRKRIQCDSNLSLNFAAVQRPHVLIWKLNQITCDELWMDRSLFRFVCYFYVSVRQFRFLYSVDLAGPGSNFWPFIACCHKLRFFILLTNIFFFFFLSQGV